jgi:acetylornithine deacetylase/succinyl-diaminopimelate desuccinylase-like protein
VGLCLRSNRVFTPPRLTGIADAAPFFTDASVLAPALDAPTLIWGPGDAALAHAVDERCPVEEIARAARGLAARPRRWAAQRTAARG